MIKSLRRLIVRFRYPFSLPEEVASSLGMHLTNNGCTFDEFVNSLIHPHFRPANLTKFMSRTEAEDAFQNAVKERFKHKTLCSYYFQGGWLEFTLLFDTESRLRRVYLNHKQIQKREGIEIPLIFHR